MTWASAQTGEQALLVLAVDAGCDIYFPVHGEEVAAFIMQDVIFCNIYACGVSARPQCLAERVALLSKPLS